MKNRLLIMIFGILISFSVSGLHATVYHVSTSGADASSGGSTSPWRTLSKANNTAIAGDVVIVHGGQYNEGIRPANNGRAGAPITFQAAPGEQVTLTASTGIQLTGGSSQYIVIDGFEIRSSFRVVDLLGASYITIRNCRCYGGRETYQAFELKNCSYCVLQNNYLDRQDPDAESGGGNGLALQGQSHHNLIEGNTVTRCEHVAFSNSFKGQNYNVWRNNVGYKNHTNFALYDGIERSVFEGNTGYYQGLVWEGGSGNCLQFTGTNCIIRFNTLYDDTATAYTMRQWPAEVGAGSGSSQGDLSTSMQYNKIYNNTVYGENDQAEWQKSAWRTENYLSGQVQNENVFKNNIFAGAPSDQVVDIDDAASSSQMNNRYDGNLLYGANGQGATVRYYFSGGNNQYTLTQVKASRSAQWGPANKEGNPLFVNTLGQGPGKDFSLRAGSPAIDGGVALTNAVAGATGSTTLVVGDAGYFCDGWGIPGVLGDSIKIEGNAAVGITRVDYSANTITLSSPCSWGQGAGVYYFRSDRFRGNAPDIGAHEYGSGAAVVTAPPSAPTPAAPADGSTVSSSSVAFAWGATPGATSYRLQVGTDNGPTSITSDQQALPGTGVTVPGFTSGTVYYWRVSASNSAGTSPWSPVRKFTAGADQTVGKNILNNSDFDAGTSAWTFYTNGVGSIQQVSPGYGDDQAVGLQISQAGSNTQLYQYNIPLEPNAKYRLSLAAYSTSGHSMDVALQQHGSPYASYGLNMHLALTNAWAVYSVDFTSSTTTTVSDGRLMFWLGPYAAGGDQYFMDRVVLEKLGSASSASTDNSKPSSFALKQNFPNPFNPSTTIQYSMPYEGKVLLKVLNVLGENVATLVDGEQTAGTHLVRFEAGKLSTGIYFYRIETPGFQETKRMLLMK